MQEDDDDLDILDGPDREDAEQDQLGVDAAGDDQDDGQGGGEPTLDPEMESKARDMGWVPKEDFRGDPEKWRPADEFVRRGEEIIPIINADRAKLRRELEEERAEFEKRVAAQERMAKIALSRQRKNLEEQFAAKKLEAVNLGDVEAYQQADEAERKALAEFDKDAAEPEPDKPNGQGLTPDQQKVVEDWKTTNDWFDNDPVLNRVAQGLHMARGETNPQEPLAENLAYVTREIKRRFPDKFKADPARNGGTFGGSRAGTGGGGKLSAKLPADAKQAFQMYVEEGAYKPDEIEDYAKEYFAQEDDR